MAAGAVIVGALLAGGAMAQEEGAESFTEWREGVRTEALSLGISASTFDAAFLGIGGIVWGRVVENVSPRFVMAGVALVMAVASALFITTDTAIEAYAYSALFGFGLGGMLTVPPVAYADYFGRPSLGAIRGVTEPFTTFGQAIGALVPGIVFDFLTAEGEESYLPAFAAFAALGLFTAFIILFARQPRKPVV